jgi:protoporphyrin/coproporphyrin ferrochelatase
MSDNNKTAVVLLNLGGPDSLDAVEPFLFNLFNDPDIINFPLSFLFRTRLAKLISSKRHPKIQEQYKKIGGKSPILDTTTKQARLLEAEINKNISAKVFIAMRYWKPFTADAIKEVEKYDPGKIILLPLYPQYSVATTGSSVKEWKKLVSLSEKLKNVETKLIEKYHLDDLYIKAFVERINQGLERFPAAKRDSVTILFSAHGTPVKLVKNGDPYSVHIKETVDKVVKAGAYRQPWSLCFQSKVGPQKWLTPSTPAIIEENAAKGVKNILVVPIAFTSDHLETLFELNIEYRHLAMEKGVKQYEVTEGLNDSTTFISALEKLVLENIDVNMKVPV